MAKVIYIEKNEHAEDIVRHLKNTSEKQVILVVPQKASLFDNINVLKNVKSNSDLLEQQVTVISLDASGLALAEKAGLEVLKPKKLFQGSLEHPLLEEKKQTLHNNIKNIWTFEQGEKKSLKTLFLPGAVVVAMAAFALVIFWYVAVARADIYLKINSQPFSSNLQIVIDSRALKEKETDGQLIIPGRLVTRNITVSQTFPSTGKKISGDQAAGEVIFYNFTEDTVIMKAEDTILRYNNLDFKLDTDILRIRPTAFIGLQGKKIDLTSLIAPQGVKAERAGEDHNLPSGTRFEVINSKLNLGLSTLYAQNSRPFSGGFKKDIRVIDQSDIDKAMRILSDKISNDAINELSKSLKKDEKLVQDKFEVKILDQEIQPTLGSETETFTLTISARLTSLAYDRVFLEKIVKNEIKALAPPGEVIDHEDQMLNLFLLDLDIASGKARMENKFSGTLHPDFDNSDFKYVLRGKSEQELNQYFKNNQAIKLIRVQFSPRWFKYVSWLNSRIFVRTE